MFLRFLLSLLIVGALALMPGGAAAASPLQGPSQTQALATQSPTVDVSNLTELTNGLAFYAVVACIIGICVSSALWAMGSRGQNPGTELAGKRGIIVCCSAAFFIGAAPAWINYLDNLARENDQTGITNVEIPVRQ